MAPLLVQLRELHVPEILFLVGIGLVLIDYFFKTDWPAHLGYFTFGLGAFLLAAVPKLIEGWEGQTITLIPALIIGLGTWLLFLLLHHFIFRKFLTNAPGKNPGEYAHD